MVVAYNSGPDLPDCLTAIRAQLGDDEIVVVDNASSDDSAAIARAFGARVERSATNIGFAAACNLGARLGRGRVLVFVNPDTVVESGWLDALVAPLEHEAGLTTSKIVLMDDPARIDTCGNSVHLSGITVCRGHAQSSDGLGSDESVLAVSGASFAVDRVSFQRLGGFDERFFMYLEDTDLSLRAALMDIPCRYLYD